MSVGIFFSLFLQKAVSKYFQEFSQSEIQICIVHY